MVAIDTAALSRTGLSHLILFCRTVSCYFISACHYVLRYGMLPYNVAMLDTAVLFNRVPANFAVASYENLRQLIMPFRLILPYLAA